MRILSRGATQGDVRRSQPMAASTSVSIAIAANSSVRYEIEYL